MDFFAFGAPKSGTTWLQSLLDAHPDVCCRPEDQLNQFVGLLPDLLERYNRMREGINERTAQYELTDQFRNSDAAAVFQFIVEIMRRKSQKPIVGTKDNSILEALDMYHTMFDEAGYACATCHNTDTEEKKVGPGLLHVSQRAPNRIPGLAAERYIYNSITDPSSFVVPDYPDNLMPHVYKDLFTEQQIYDIIAYLMTLN